MLHCNIGRLWSAFKPRVSFAGHPGRRERPYEHGSAVTRVTVRDRGEKAIYSLISFWAPSAILTLDPGSHSSCALTWPGSRRCRRATALEVCNARVTCRGAGSDVTLVVEGHYYEARHGQPSRQHFTVTV
jgi:hypothetical protein